MEIRKILVLSTAHVREETGRMLDNTDHELWPVSGGPYGDVGWFVYAHDEDVDGNIPEEMMAVFEFARANGCDNVLFDCDAEVIDDLSHWDW